MVATLEEVTAWSLDDIREGIRVLMPEGWVFEERSQHVRLMCPLEKGFKVEWEHFHIDPKYLLLGAYGHLWLRQHKPSPDSPWVRRNNPSREAVTRQVARRTPCCIPDPADVDPAEVEAVYEQVRKKP
jgi:hypothetical protein